jgi:D-alanyl-D-alanine carboxypeptidase/D-alanyl-D-alanine-endopeptidase (penicillin-binding protein 4)
LTTAQAADVKIRAWLLEHGLDLEGLVLENGSGLSRIERLRPSQLAAVLRLALASRWAPEFLASLPIASVDGSMRKRLGGMPLEARARLKTGTLRDVSAVAGYVHDDMGRDLIVVAILNDPRATREVGHPILDALLGWALRANDRAATPAATAPGRTAP